MKAMASEKELGSFGNLRLTRYAKQIIKGIEAMPIMIFILTTGDNNGRT